jgi:hypothetical protein
MHESGSLVCLYRPAVRSPPDARLPIYRRGCHRNRWIAAAEVCRFQDQSFPGIHGRSVCHFRSLRGI